MQDEHFMQGWNGSHRQFSADLDRGVTNLVDRLSGRQSRPKAIRDAYGIPRGTASPLSPAAKASLRGFAASVLTVALWVVVLALATPAPGLAASGWAFDHTCACIDHPPLA